MISDSLHDAVHRIREYQEDTAYDHCKQAVDAVTDLMDRLRFYLDALPPTKLSDEHEGLLEGLRLAIANVDLAEVNAAKDNLGRCIEKNRFLLACNDAA